MSIKIGICDETNKKARGRNKVKTMKRSAEVTHEEQRERNNVPGQQEEQVASRRGLTDS